MSELSAAKEVESQKKPKKKPVNLGFRKRSLTWLSSHPEHVKQRWRQSRWFAGMLFLVLAVFMVMRLVREGGLSDFIANFLTTWPLRFGIVAAVGVTIVMTYSLLLRMTMLRRYVYVSKQFDSDGAILNRKVSLLFIFLIAAAGMCLPIGMFFMSKGLWFRVLSAVVAFLPLGALIGVLLYCEWKYLAGIVRYRENAFSWILKWLGRLLLIMAIFSLAFEFLKWMQGKGWFELEWLSWGKEVVTQLESWTKGWYPSRAAEGLAYGMTAISILILARKICQTPEYIDPDAVEEPKKKKKSWLRRMFGWFPLLWPFGKKPGSGEEDAELDAAKDAEPEPNWVSEILQEMGLEHGDVEIRSTKRGDRARWVSTELDSTQELRNCWLFGIRIRPTIDQALAVNEFIDLGLPARALNAIENPVNPPAMDLIIDGEVGSGRTTAIMAMAAHALVARGQRVVVITPSDSRAVSWERRFRRLLEELGFLRFTSVYGLSAHKGERVQELDNWLDGVEPFPNIFIGTAEQFQLWFQGQTNRRKQQSRQLLPLLEVILVEDFFEHGPLVQQHLPFMLDAHRLVLQAFSSRLQTVVSLPSLGEFAAKRVIGRLFPQVIDPTEHRANIRMRHNIRGWRIVVPSDDPRETLIKMAVRSLERERIVLVFQKDGDPRRLSALRTEINSNVPSARRDSLQIFGDFDELSSEDVNPAGVILTISHMDDTIGYALQAWGNHEECVVFQIMPKDSILVGSATGGICPVLASRDARGFLVDHLSGALACIPERWPIPLRAWQLIGLLPGMVAVSDERIRRILATFSVDQRDPGEESRDAADFIYLDELRALPGEELGPKSITRYPSRAGRIASAPGRPDGIQLELFHDTDRVDLGTCEVRWTRHEEGRAELDRSDLRHLVDFRYRRGEGFLVPTDFRYDEEEGYEFVTTFATGAGFDSIYPKWNFAWSGLPRANHIQIRGGGSHPIRYFTVDLDDFGLLDCKIAERFNDIGQLEEISPPIEFSYRARVTGILLGAKDFDGDPSKLAQQLLDLRWTSEDNEAKRARYLTLAFERAFRRVMPGYENYGRCVALELTGKLARYGEAVVWILENDTSGQSVSDAVMAVMALIDDQKYWRGRLFGEARRTLKYFQKKTDAASRDRAARVLAKMDFGTGEGTADALAFAFGVLTDILGDEAVPTGEIEHDVEAETAAAATDSPFKVEEPPKEEISAPTAVIEVVSDIPSELDRDPVFRYLLLADDKDEHSQIAVKVPDEVIDDMKQALLPSKGRHYHRADFRGVEDLIDLNGPLLHGVGKEEMRRFVRQFATRAKRMDWDRNKLANEILGFVQRSISFAEDLGSTGFEEYARFPLQTLVDGCGDSECQAILTLSLLLYLGFDCALLVFELDHGAATHYDPALRINPSQLASWNLSRRSQLFGDKKTGFYLYGSATSCEPRSWGRRVRYIDGKRITHEQVIPFSVDDRKLLAWDVDELPLQPAPPPAALPQPPPPTALPQPPPPTALSPASTEETSDEIDSVPVIQPPSVQDWTPASSVQKNMEKPDDDPDQDDKEVEEIPAPTVEQNQIENPSDS
ncbi:MAG: hypothetical protein ACI8UO_002686 [Verrucomicrobiales bacterium]|jgi:hypothetical protein